MSMQKKYEMNKDYEFANWFCLLLSNEIGVYYNRLSSVGRYTNTIDLMYSSIYSYTYGYMKNLNYFDLGAIHDAFDISGVYKTIILGNKTKDIGRRNFIELDITSVNKLDTTVAHKYFLSVIMQILCLIISKDADVKLSNKQIAEFVLKSKADILNSLVTGLYGIIKFSETKKENIYRDVQIILDNDQFIMSTQGFYKRYDCETLDNARLLGVIGTIQL